MTSLYLHHAPILDSLHVYLNGVEQFAPQDWNYLTGPPRLVTTPAMEARSQDLLEAKYAWSASDTSGGVGATPDPAPGPGSKGGNTYPGGPVDPAPMFANYQPSPSCPESVNFFGSDGRKNLAGATGVQPIVTFPTSIETSLAGQVLGAIPYAPTTTFRCASGAPTGPTPPYTSGYQVLGTFRNPQSGCLLTVELAARSGAITFAFDDTSTLTKPGSFDPYSQLIRLQCYRQVADGWIRTQDYGELH